MSSERPQGFPFPRFAEAGPQKPLASLFESFDAQGSVPSSPDPADAERSLEDVQQRIARIEQEAYEKAFVLGEKAGREMGEASVAPLLEKLSAALASVCALRPLLIREAEREVMELSFAIAKAVVAREIDLHPDIVLENVRKALVKAGEGGRVMLRVNPGDAAMIWRERGELSDYLEGRGDLRIEPDPGVERGGCVAVTDFTEADATIAGQMAALYEALSSAGEDPE